MTTNVVDSTRRHPACQRITAEVRWWSGPRVARAGRGAFAVTVGAAHPATGPATARVGEADARD